MFLKTQQMENLIIPEINKIFDCDILAPNKLQKNVDGRIAFSQFMRCNSGLSLQKIGDLIEKNHATIIHHIKTHSQLMRFNREYREKYKTIGVYSGFKRWLCIECEFEIKTIKYEL